MTSFSARLSRSFGCRSLFFLLFDEPVSYINTDGVASRHDARTGRGANRAGLAVIKLHPRLRQVIDIWSFIESGTISAKIHHPHIIDQEEDKICLLFEGKCSEQR